MDFIIVGQQPWDTEVGSNCKNIALELSKNHRVLYVNSPLDRITLLKNGKDHNIAKRNNIIKGKETGLIKIQENLWNYYPDVIVESINWINNTGIFSFFNKRNNRKFAASIKKAIDNLGFKSVILFNDNEMFKAFYLQDYLKPNKSIYYSRDYMLGVDYWKKHGLKLEPELIGKSDFCFANSEYLAEYCRRYNPESYYVGQGCDVTDFLNVSNTKPADIKDIANTIIGYVGALNSARLDINIIEYIASSLPNFSVVLVGPEDDAFRASKLHDMGNVFFLGQKAVEELPGYINAFDICINPQLVNEITIGNYPRKIDEYLVLGKPTVATATKTMEVFKDYVYLTNSAEGYVQLIKQALGDNTEELKQARITYALSHNWEESVKLMTDHLN